MDCLDEDTLGALAEGRLPPPELAQAEAHLDACAGCRLLLAELVEPERETAAPGLRRGDRVRRYVILGLLGEGGMGQVYAAYDPELDRRVALKLVPAGAHGEAAEARLLREAQTLGRLSHARLLRVHDVGLDAGRLFFAMDLVEGQTLRAWLHEGPQRPRPLPAILAAFCAAGEGLAAAHAAGVLHRDFKPDNVLCDRGGQVVVADFGLARLLAEPAGPATPGPPGPHGPPEPPGPGDDDAGPPAALTRSGHVPGTPAYLAPELYAGGPATARADQYSFCVALYEALYGERPFRGRTRAELRAAVLTGAPQPPPGARVPGWLRQVLLRGLARDPSARYPSMDALLAALSAGLARPRRRAALGVLLGGGVLLGALALLLGAGPGAARAPLVSCLAAGRRSGLESSPAPALRAYGAAWSSAWRELCLSAHLFRAQAAGAAEAQAACLELARDEAVAQDRGGARGEAAADAPLRPLARCGPLAAAARGWPARGEPGRALRDALAQARVQLAAGRPDPALAAAEAAVTAARDRDAARAEARLLRGSALLARGQTAAGTAELKEALWLAQSAQHDAAAAEALVALAEHAATGPAPATGWHPPDYVKAVLARAGGDARLTARLSAATRAAPK